MRSFGKGQAHASGGALDANEAFRHGMPDWKVLHLLSTRLVEG